MHGLGAGFGIGVLALTLTSSVSFARIGQPGEPVRLRHSRDKTKSVLAVSAPRTAAVKRKAFTSTPPPSAAEEQAQPPSDQSQTRAWLQDAARQEPVPDEQTLQMQLQESKRLQQQRERNSLKAQPPSRTLEAPDTNRI